MPSNKNAYIRHRFIDSLLRDNDYVKTDEIIDKLYERHDIPVKKEHITTQVMLMTYFQQ
jgi:hypothetical protein